MFESKEEVERTMLALKIFPDIGHVGDVEQEEPDTDEEEYAPQVGRDFLILHPHMISDAKLKESKKNTLKRNAQVFPEHTESETRYTRSLYYGVLPATDRPSLPLTRQDLCINVPSISPWMH